LEVGGFEAGYTATHKTDGRLRCIFLVLCVTVLLVCFCFSSLSLFLSLNLN